MYTIMIIEDNIKIRDELSNFLINNGYKTNIATDFIDVITYYKNNTVDCILLDLSLPHIEGHYLVREFRKVSKVPIIVVTSRDSSLDEVIAMNLGADDFVTKPYNLQILLARLQAVLRRTYERQDPTTLIVKGVHFDTLRGTIAFEDRVQTLTKNEIGILFYLFDQKNTIVSRDALIKYLWNTDWFVDDNTLTVNINRLRKKLESIHVKNFIETKRGMGYTIHED